MSREEAISLLTQVNKILVNSNSWLENTHEPLNMAFDMAIKALEQEPSVLQDIKSELWMEGMNMAGEYQGVWVRYRDIERVIDKHISGK